MGKAIDLTGMTFGEWTVLGFDESSCGNSGGRRWICRCSCGRVKSVLGNLLRRGESKSCGHDTYKKLSKALTKDITGQRFGRLVAISIDHYKSSGSSHGAYWKCHCDCGNDCVVLSYHLTSGTTKSCGCLMDETFGKQITHHLYNSRLYGIYAHRRRCAMALDDPSSYMCVEWIGDNMEDGIRRFAEWSYNNGYTEQPKDTPKSDKLILVQLDKSLPLSPDNAQWVVRKAYYKAKPTKQPKPKKSEKSEQSKRQRRAKNIDKDGRSKTRLYRIYKGMLSRCNNPNRKNYNAYGGRGIKVCSEWYTPGIPGNPGYTAFKEWAYAHGYHDQPRDTKFGDLLSIDRIDVDGNYTPDNCQWIPMWMQAANRTKTCFINDGKTTYTWAEAEKVYFPKAAKDKSYNGVKWIDKRVTDGWSGHAIVYAMMHQELGVERHKNGCYYDKNGFYVMIPKIGFVAVGRNRQKKMGLESQIIP